MVAFGCVLLAFISMQLLVVLKLSTLVMIAVCA
jgi:hypothetical protein